MIKRHELLPGDRQRRSAFCQWLLARPDRFLDDLLIGDESGFAMNATVNTHNLRAYRARGHQPHEFDYQRSDTRSKITVWAGLMGNGDIIGPVDGIAWYRRRNGRFQRLWWAQDGAPCHRTREVTDRLTELFGGRVIALRQAVEWPPRSPDLTPLDYFLWGHLKAKVYVTPPANLEDLRRRITVRMEELQQDRGMIRRAVRDMLRRARLCVERGGGHVDD